MGLPTSTKKKDPENPAWRLFHIPYRVGIPEVYFYDPEWVSVYGRPTSGNKKVDSQILKTERTVWWTVDKIVEVWGLGADVSLRNWKEDPFLIYKDIQEHLQEWSLYLGRFEQSLNKINFKAPVEDLVLFSMFADMLFPLTGQVDPLKLQSGRLENLRTFGRRGRFSVRSGRAETPLPEVKEDFKLDGTHVFAPGINDFVVPVPEQTHEEKVINAKQSLKDKDHKSYTDFLEDFMATRFARLDNGDQQ